MPDLPLDALAQLLRTAPSALTRQQGRTLARELERARAFEQAFRGWQPVSPVVSDWVRQRIARFDAAYTDPHQRPPAGTGGPP